MFYMQIDLATYFRLYLCILGQIEPAMTFILAFFKYRFRTQTLVGGNGYYYLVPVTCRLLDSP